MSRTRRAALNWVTSSLLSFMPLILTLILLPKIVGYLGQERYGIFRVLSEWVGFSTVFTVALSGFFAQRIARSLADNKLNLSSEVRRAIKFSFHTGIVLFLSVGILLWICSPILFPSNAIDPVERNWALFWSVATLLLLPSLPIQSLFEALQRGFQVNLIIIGQRFLIVVGSWYVASQTASLAWQSFVLFAGSALTALTFVIVAKNEFSAYLISDNKVSMKAKEVRDFIANSFPFMKIDFAGRLGMSADTLLISYIMGNSSVTIFYLALRIPALLTNQIFGLGNSIWAGFLEFHRLGNKLETLRLFVFVSKLTVGLASIAAVLVGLLNGSATQLWLGGLSIQQPIFHMLIGFNIIPITLVSLWGWLATALGEEKRFARISLESALINIAVGIGLTYYFGFLGPAFGSLAGYGLFKTIRMYNAISKLVGFTQKQFLELTIIPTTIVIVFLILGESLLRDFAQSPTWLGLSAYAVVISGLLGLSFYFYFSFEERVRIRHLILR